GIPQPHVPLPAHRDPLRRFPAGLGARLPAAPGSDVFRRARVAQDQIHRPVRAPGDPVQLPLHRERPPRMGRNDPRRPQDSRTARVRRVLRRRDLPRPERPDRRGDPRLGGQGRRDRAAPLVHREDGRRGRRRAQPRNHGGLWHSGAARRRRLRDAVRDQRQHLRPHHDARRTGGRPHRRQRDAAAAAGPVLPPRARDAALPRGRPAERRAAGHRCRRRGMSNETSTTPAAGAIPPINWPVFIWAAIGAIAITLWAFLAPENAESVLGAVVGWTSDWFGWFYVALAGVVLAFVIYLALSRFGNTKLGPENAKPEFSTMAWASMLFAAGIGTDLMFFAVAEPVTQYLE